MVRGRYLYIFWSKGQRSRSSTELCQHFGSDTITWVVFNVQLSYFIHRCRMVRGRYLYIFGSAVQRSKVTTELCQHFGSDTITWGSFQRTAFIIIISYIDGRWWEEDTYTFSGQKVKDQGHNGTLWTLWFWHNNFGSDTITWVVFNVQLPYFIHRYRMARGRYLYILGSKGQCSRSQQNFVNTLVLTQILQ